MKFKFTWKKRLNTGVSNVVMLGIYVEQIYIKDMLMSA